MKTTLLVFALCTVFTALTWADDSIDPGDLAVAQTLIQQGYYTNLNEAIHAANILSPGELETAKGLNALGILADMNEAVSVAWRNDRSDIECAKRQPESKTRAGFFHAMYKCAFGE